MWCVGLCPTVAAVFPDALAISVAISWTYNRRLRGLRLWNPGCEVFFMEGDLRLPCCDCGKLFLFTALEQQFFKTKGLNNLPKRCANCRLTNRNWRRVQRGESVPPLSSVECAECAALTKVPFNPTGHRPVYCSYCLHAVVFDRRAQDAELPEQDGDRRNQA